MIALWRSLLAIARSSAARPLIAAASALVLMVAALSVSACSRRPPNATPDGAVRELVERMQRVQGDPADAKAAYMLLSKRAQSNLAERAQRYSAASGKAIAPEAMLVPSHFLLRFEPQRYSAQIAGAHALVIVEGLRPEERAQIPCVFEEEAWRVDLALPPLPPVQMRPGP
jgi:hypothetical protein